jgi:hypothetical protein
MKGSVSKAFSFYFNSTLFGRVAFAVSLMSWLVWPETGMAYVANLGDMFCSVTTNLISSSGHGNFGIPSLIQGFAYIAGALAIASGLLHLVKRHDAGYREAPSHQILGRFIGGAGLMALPSVVQWLFNTLALQSGDRGINVGSGCNDYFHPGAAYGGIGLDGMMINLVENITNPMTVFLSVVCLIVGMVLVFKGLSKATKYGTDPRAHSMPNILINLVVGAFLITIGTSLEWVFNTIFGGVFFYPGDFWANFSGGTLYKEMALTGTDFARFQTTITEALTFFQIIGYIGFIRGWLILKDAVEGSGQAKVAQGLTHIFGGAMAANIFFVLDLFDHTFGTGFIS